MTQCSIISEAVHTLRNRIVEEDFAVRANAARIADVSNHFHFSKSETRSLRTADGLNTQIGMDMTEKTSGRVRTVICAAVDGEWVWFVENMAGCPVSASDLIQCVKARIGARLSGQLGYTLR